MDRGRHDTEPCAGLTETKLSGTAAMSCADPQDSLHGEPKATAVAKLSNLVQTLTSRTRLASGTNFSPQKHGRRQERGCGKFEIEIT